MGVAPTYTGTFEAVSIQKKLGVSATWEAAAFKLELKDGIAKLITSDE